MENKSMITDGDNYCLYNENCMEAMKWLPDGCVDMVMCDLPYGTTACKWDTIIPFEPLWAAYRRVCKKNAAIVLTASQPFTSVLVMSNVKNYKHLWVWDKGVAANFTQAKNLPLAVHEDVVVFLFREAKPQLLPPDDSERQTHEDGWELGKARNRSLRPPGSRRRSQGS